MRGNLVVFEGLDASGKSTQLNLLSKYLDREEVSYRKIHFPNYESKFGKMIKKYLDGDNENYNPYFIATLYANDRYYFKPMLEDWLNRNDLVICDRYIYSALAFQGCELSDKNGHELYDKRSERERFIDWLCEYEFKQNKIPVPDLVLYFNVPIDFIKKNLDKKQTDIHEKVEYQKKVKRVYEDIFKKMDNAYYVDYEEGGHVLNQEEVNRRIINILQRKGVL